LTEISRHAKRY